MTILTTLIEKSLIDKLLVLKAMIKMVVDWVRTKTVSLLCSVKFIILVPLCTDLFPSFSSIEILKDVRVNLSLVMDIFRTCTLLRLHFIMLASIVYTCRLEMKNSNKHPCVSAPMELFTLVGTIEVLVSFIHPPGTIYLANFFRE